MTKNSGKMSTLADARRYIAEAKAEGVKGKDMRLVKRIGSKTTVRGNHVSMRRIETHWLQMGTTSVQITAALSDRLHTKEKIRTKTEGADDPLRSFVHAVRDGDPDAANAAIERAVRRAKK